MAQKKWSAQMTKSLVECYELQPILYKTKNPNYHNKVMRHNAVENIKFQLNKIYKEDITNAEVLKKINNIRSQFLETLRAQRKQPASGSEADKKPVWWLFSHLQFLLPHVQKDAGKSSLLSCSTAMMEDMEEHSESMSQIDQENFEDFTNDNTLNIDCGLYDVAADGQCLFSPEASEVSMGASTSGASTPGPDASTPGPSASTPKQRQKRKKTAQTATIDSNNYGQIIEKALQQIVDSPPPPQEDAASKDVKSFSTFLEAQLLKIKNKDMRDTLMWDILNLVRDVQLKDV